MTRVQSIIVMVIALMIGYGAGYFTHLLRLPPGVAHGFFARSVSTKPSPQYRSPLIPVLEEAKKLRSARKLPEAQKLLQNKLQLYPQAPEAQKARDLLGSINTELFFSDKSLYGKVEHIVERGESLARIARKLNSTPEMIMRANNLDSTLIHPGDRLIVPDGEFTVTIDLPNERVVVHHGDAFFKQYPIKSVDLPATHQRRVTTKVDATVFWKDGERVSPKNSETAEATPWIHLSRQGYVLYGVSEESGVDAEAVEVFEQPDSDPSSSNETPGPPSATDYPPRGIALLRDDLIELESFLRRGTPVTVIRAKE